MDYMSSLSFNEDFIKIFESAVGSTREGVTVAEMGKSDHPLVFVNRAFCKITGYEPDEALGKNCRFLQGPETDAKEVRKIRGSLRDGKHCLATLLNYRKDGSPFWNRLSLVPVFDFNRELRYFVGIQSDITQEVRDRENRAQFEAMRATLQAVNNVVYNFFSYLKYMRSELENPDTLSANLKEFDQYYEQTLSKLEKINRMKQYKETKIFGNIRALDVDDEKESNPS